MAVVTTAMLRQPAGGLHESPYYAGQRVNFKPTDTQRRKKSSPDKSIDRNGEYFYGTIGATSGSALSKSMKYAETWLYGTVRGSPPAQARPSLFSPYGEIGSPVLVTSPQNQQQNYAVIVCTCPEYLNGTKKNNGMKVSICKKCKGSRLPIVVANGTIRGQAMGGTLRGPHNVHSHAKNVARAGTVKLTPNNKSRPSILALTSQTDSTDPYDLMRRTRLASPVESSSQFSTSRSRARSTSPPRVRSRKKSPTNELPNKRSQSICRLQNVQIQDSSNYQRRSILECKVNPYELMNKSDLSKITKNGNVYDDIGNDKKAKSLNKKNPPKHNGPYASVQAVGGKRVRVFGNKTPSVEIDELLYDDVDVQDINGFANAEKRMDSVIYSASLQNTDNDLLNVHKISFETFRDKINKDTKINSISLLSLKNGSPKRPPRRQKSEPIDIKISKIPKDTKLFKSNKLDNKQINSEVIKSILKKPRPDSSAISVKDDFEIVTTPPSKSATGSQFYIPTPLTCRALSHSNINRKKVQFLVETENIPIKVIMVESDDTSEIVQGNEEENLVKEEDVVTVNNNNVEISDLIDLNHSYNIHEDENDTIIYQEPLHLSSTPLKPRSVLLRRSQSERIADSKPKEYPMFLDSLALRPKQMRAQSNQIFFNDISIVNSIIDHQEKPAENKENDNIYSNVENDGSVESTIIIKVPTQAANTQNECTEDKTILKISPAASNDDLSATIDEQNICDEPQRTSIQISGDDCYSTVNVNTDTSTYQSSVILSTQEELRHDKDTVTISITNSRDIGRRRNSSQIYIQNTTNIFPIEAESDNTTLLVLDYDTLHIDDKTTRGTNSKENLSEVNSTHELGIFLRDPVEAVKRNLVPHVCGKVLSESSSEPSSLSSNPVKSEEEIKGLSKFSFVAKLLEDPMLGHLAEGLESELVAKLIENSLLRLKKSKSVKEYGDDEETMSRLIDVSLLKLQEHKEEEEGDAIVNENKIDEKKDKENAQEEDICSAPYESMEYDSGVAGNILDTEPLSDCYNASASELSTEDENNSTRSKFYQMLVDATLSEIEISNTLDDDHHYESIRLNSDPIYEEIGELPPPLPLNPPPAMLNNMDDDKQSRSIFEGASKYDILSYLVDAKERGIVPEDTYTFSSYTNNNESINEEAENKDKETIHQRQNSDLSSRVSQLSNASDSSEESSLVITNASGDSLTCIKKSSSEIERNDSGVGSETSKSSRSRWQGHNIPPNCILDKDSPIHLCEDCDSAVETQVTESGVVYAPLVCRKCSKKRAERKEIITEIIETEEKYGRDLQIILEEFYKPMLVAGLLTSDQLSTIFLNVEELLENNQVLAERLRDALEIAVEQGDEDLLTVNIGKLMLECASMLHAFSTYCIRQGAASMLLASLEKEKELLRIFLRVSQMENTVLRRMNLNSFLMVPVQRVTKYPLLLSRLYKVTPPHVEGRELLKQSQQKIELHLTHMNSEAKDMTSLKLWRRISSSGSGRRSSSEIDMTNIKLRKMAVDVLEWNHEEARFVMEGRLLYTQPNDNNWRKGRTIKLTPINALLVTIGKPTKDLKPSTNSQFGSQSSGIGAGSGTGVREATLLLIREKGGRYSLLREPLFLDRVVVAAEPEWDDYFEVQEITSKDTFIFKAEQTCRTVAWRGALQRLCRGAGAWRRRRPALANIMINGMLNRH